MDSNDRTAIADLFDRLSQVEGQRPDRDPEAERFIGDAIARQPGAPYYMAQTLVVQDHAIRAAQNRIEQLEAALDEARHAADGGGFLSGLFGDSPPPRQAAAPARSLPKGAPGGFLAGAAQTAIGVAGGVFVADVLADLLVGEAQAADVPAGPEPGFGEPGFGDDGDW